MAILVPFSIEHYHDSLRLWSACEGIGLSSADSPQAIRLFLDRNPGLSCVAIDDDRVVGTALVGHDGRRGFIHHLAVSPEHRRKGIGAQLVERCIDQLRQAGIEKCHIHVLRSNAEGEAFWQRQGFEPRIDIGIMSRAITRAGD